MEAGGGVPVSLVDIKKWRCPMSLKALMSHVAPKMSPCYMSILSNTTSCHLFLFSCYCMSHVDFKKRFRVAVSNLSIKGHTKEK